jgi:hypothetical protein
MMGLFSFRLEMKTTNMERFDTLQERLSDFSTVFTNIIENWAKGNKQKFAAGKFAESTGVYVDSQIFWEPVTQGYYNQKHAGLFANRLRMSKKKRTYPDWLMVRTGDLMNSLTSTGPGGFSKFVSAHEAIFGRPLSSEDADKAMFNKEKRPSIFIGRSDRLMIEAEMKHYLSLGERYKGILEGRASIRSARRKALLNQSARIDVEFQEVVA